jgi:hypothetical protein
MGQGVGGGPQGSLPNLSPLGPMCEKKWVPRREADFAPKPTVKPGAPEEPPPSYRSWVLQFEVAD